jgi:hypothetical protein
MTPAIQTWLIHDLGLAAAARQVRQRDHFTVFTVTWAPTRTYLPRSTDP